MRSGIYEKTKEIPLWLKSLCWDESLNVTP
jgi:hypothetical protein